MLRSCSLLKRTVFAGLCLALLSMVSAAPLWSQNYPPTGPIVQPQGAQSGPLAKPHAAIEATKLHVIVLGLTNPNDGIGVACGKDIVAVKRFFEQSFVGMSDRLLIHDMSGAGWTANKVMEALRTLPIQADENVLFYHSGHGAMLKKNGSVAHKLLIDGGTLDRDLVRDELTKHKPRGVILLTDCCSSYVEARGGERFARAAQGPNVQSVRNLFLGVRGVVDITAALDGTSAISTHVGPNATGSESAFTVALLSLLFETNPTFTSWHDLFPVLARATLERSGNRHEARQFSLGELVNP